MSAAERPEADKTGAFELMPGVVWQVVDDGIMLLDVAQGHYFELNASGARMFELLLASSTEQAERALLKEFAVDAAQLRQDLAALVDSLQSAGLLKAVPAEESRP